MSAAPTDEIFEKYLQQGDHGDQRAGARGGARGRRRGARPGRSAPATRSADILLLKYEPRPAELQEGVAFFGRAGQAVLKSLQRLRVDPMAIYGTNCLKLAGQDAEEARPWLARELHIVQPKLVVVMGERALEFLNALEFPLARPLEARPGELQRFTPATEALFTPDVDESLDEQAAKTAFWRAFKVVGSWWAELPPY